MRYATSMDVEVEERLSRHTSLSNVEAEQVRIATDEPDLATALEITEDRGPVRRARLVDHSTDDRYTMILVQEPDHEIGAIFRAGEFDPVATIDDGSIGDCTVRELVPASSVECLFGSSTVQMARLANDLVVGDNTTSNRVPKMFGDGLEATTGLRAVVRTYRQAHTPQQRGVRGRTQPLLGTQRRPGDEVRRTRR